jgi:hypothetical protein
MNYKIICRWDTTPQHSNYCKYHAKVQKNSNLQKKISEKIPEKKRVQQDAPEKWKDSKDGMSTKVG